MKKVITTPAVDLALRTLSPEEIDRIQSWFGQLANWDSDPLVRENSYALAEMPGVRMFRTGSDTRIFFTIEGETITILDVARKQAIMTTVAR
jgi:mRNA-degrading endonuclease RelE of RelBE toxin-antitoxin system